MPLEGLYAWARHLVMVVVLAGFCELLLPGSNIKKPVRLVLALVVMMAVLAPLLSFLHRPLDPDAWVAAVATGGRRLEYQQSAQALRRVNGDLTRQELRQRLELAAEVAARQVPGVAGARARVELAEEGANAAPQIKRVQLWLRPGGQGVVEPVAPVQIGPHNAGPPAPDPLARAAVRAVAQQLGIGEELVSAQRLPGE